MKEVTIQVFDCGGNKIFDKNMSSDNRLNQIYIQLYKLYFYCKINLLYNKQIMPPFKKINDITTDLVIIFDIAICYKLVQLDDNLILDIAINTQNKISEIIYSYNNFIPGCLVNLRAITNFINKNYNCLNIISICHNYYHTAILFEDKTLIIVNNYTCYFYDSGFSSINIIATFDNVTKIITTAQTFGIIINDTEFIKFDKEKKFHKYEDLTNIDYKYIYVIGNLFFIISQEFITIVYTQHLSIVQYKINNINKIYYTPQFGVNGVIAAIKENGCLILFKILPNYKLSIYPFENINNYPIKKILSIESLFVIITHDDNVFIYSNYEWIIERYELIKNKLKDVNDIVISVSTKLIGILKKNNDIIILSSTSLNIIFEQIEPLYSNIYKQIISTNYNIFLLANNNKVYKIQKQTLFKTDVAPIEILDNIKEFYSNYIDLIAISYDNIVYASQFPGGLYYKQQFLDLKAIKINKYTFIIIKNNNELIKIDFRKNEGIATNEVITTNFNDTIKFITIKGMNKKI